MMKLKRANFRYTMLFKGIPFDNKQGTVLRTTSVGWLLFIRMINKYRLSVGGRPAHKVAVKLFLPLLANENGYRFR